MRCACLLTLACLFFLAGIPARAADPKPAKKVKENKVLPYLGPGADKLSAADYERVYKNYIQTSLLLGYPFQKEKGGSCEQALHHLFRSAGLYGYPVPKEAQQVQRSSKTMKDKWVETYELGGFIVQVARHAKTNALDRLVLVNSSSPLASRRLSAFVKKELLSLERDPVTNLERVQGIPVGYPHPFLGPEGQGLFVKVLRFNGKAEGCEPLDFQDNAWVGGFDLSESRCTELQGEAEKVWGEKMAPEDFAKAELKRMKALALQNALAKGTPEKEAKVLIDKHFTPPLTNEINVVGSAMRNLAQCNLLALGRGGKGKISSGTGGESSGPSDSGPGAGTAK